MYLLLKFSQRRPRSPRVFRPIQKRVALLGALGPAAAGRLGRIIKKKGHFQAKLPWKVVGWHELVHRPQLPEDGNRDQLWPNYESCKPALCPSFSSSLTTQRGRENGWDSGQVLPATTMWPRSQANDVQRELGQGMRSLSSLNEASEEWGGEEGRLADKRASQELVGSECLLRSIVETEIPDLAFCHCQNSKFICLMPTQLYICKSIGMKLWISGIYHVFYDSSGTKTVLRIHFYTDREPQLLTPKLNT